jgi:hypothetical protein
VVVFFDARARADWSVKILMHEAGLTTQPEVRGKPER